jgi:molecular chaperone GrpE
MTSEPKADEPVAASNAGAETKQNSASPEQPHATSYVDPTIAMEAQIAGLEAQVKDLTDRLLRTHAEMENIRKRTERDKADTVKYAITKFAGDIVTVGDNFQRAVNAVPAGAAEGDPALRSLIDGVTLIERDFLGVLERHGVTRLDPKGQAFDPNFHQAVMEQPNAELPSGTVLQVFQAGYVIDDRILRPAMVAVSTGGPKPAKPAEAKPEQKAETPAPNPADEAETISKPSPGAASG